MAKIFVNRPIDLSVERAWTAQNGSTKHTLVLISKLGETGPTTVPNVPITAMYGKLIKGNHSFIYLNPPSEFPAAGDDNRILGIFLNEECGYEVKEGEELFASSSIGGPDNSESKFGIYEEGTLLYVTTYMNRKPASYHKLTSNGWITLTPIEGTI